MSNLGKSVKEITGDCIAEETEDNWMKVDLLIQIPMKNVIEAEPIRES